MRGRQPGTALAPPQPVKLGEVGGRRHATHTSLLHWALMPALKVQPNLTSWQGSQASTGQWCGCAARCPAGGWSSTAAALSLELTGKTAAYTRCWVSLSSRPRDGQLPALHLCAAAWCYTGARSVKMVRLMRVSPRALC